MLCNGKCVYLCVFEIEGEKVNCVCVCVKGGPDPWGADGDHSEVYGESLSTHLV